MTFNVNCKCREMCQKPTKKYFFYYATSSLHSCIVKFDAKINSEWVTNKQNHREASLSKRHTTYEKSWRCTWSSSWERASGSDSAVSRVLAMIFATGRGFTPPCNNKSIKLSRIFKVCLRGFSMEENLYPVCFFVHYVGKEEHLDRSRL